MKRVNLLLLIGLMFSSLSVDLSSQDIHFTNNDILPTFFNPAQTGAFAGTYRAGLLLRDQWRPHKSQPYTSAGLFIDSPIIFGLSKQHWVGVGATLFYDKSGEVSQTWNGFYPGVSYHIGLDKKFRNVITIGAQYGFSNRGYSDEGAVTEHTLLTGPNDPDLENIKGTNATEGFSDGYSDLNIGVMYKSRLDKFSKLEIGAAYMHVLNPSFNFNTPTTGTGGGGRANIGSRINVHTKYRRASSRRMIWEPSAYVSMMPGASNIQVQLRNEYLVKKKGDFSIITGLGLRFGDSVQLLTGANYKDWIIAFSYDYVISSLASQGIVSAYELGVKKIFLVNKKPKVKPIIYCPRL